jgi:hypothetical protein
VPSELQRTVLSALVGVLRPVINLCLRCGISYTEFSQLSRSLYISVASSEFGLRGRPTNASRVAAMTGISRKEIRKVREAADTTRWTPAMEVSPVNLLLHYWHFDDDFSLAPGIPAPIPAEGKNSFHELARRYAGDIPTGAIREELKRAKVIEESNGLLSIRKRYYQPADFDDDFIRNILYSLQNLASTVVHNAKLVCLPDFTESVNEAKGRFERFAWTDKLSDESKARFRIWVRKEGATFIETADHWIGNAEKDSDNPRADGQKTVGVGIYYFEED